MTRWGVAAVACVAGAAVVLALIPTFSGWVATQVPRVPEQSEPSTPSACTTPAQEPPYYLDAASAGYIEYRPVSVDIVAPVTKFGGQPVWLDEPQWPLAHIDGEQMEFVGQIELDRFEGGDGKIAYLFVAADPDGDGPVGPMGDLPETWDPFVGDNAVIIQPGGDPQMPVSTKPTGPTVVTFDEAGEREQVYAADLEERIDPRWQTDYELRNMDDEERLAYWEPAYLDKVGGTPIFVQGAEFPGCGAYSTLALQLTYVPFWLNLGDGGTGFLFLNDDASSGVWLSQSH